MTAPNCLRDGIGFINGVDTTALFKTASAMRANPELTRFEYRAKNEWLGGDRSRTTIKEFSGAGAIHRRETAGFQAHAGEHQVLLGQDKAPNPIEWLLHSLVSCMTATLAYQGASRGIVIDAIESAVAGNIDLRGFLGLSDGVHTGYDGIRVNMRIKSEASPIVLKSLAKRSPVFDIVARSVPINVTISTY